MIKTNLAQTVEAINDSGLTYDTNVKYLLADRQILSRILKYTIEEFRDMDVQDIMDSISDDIEIGTKPVDAGLANLGRVKGTATEDNVPGEGIIYYDIRFTAYHKEKEIKILINIEAQKSSDSGKLGYHLENRIVFYLARMKKVRSIWLCMDNDAAEDSIEEISFDRKTVFGNKKNPYHADLMKGIIVNIRDGENISAGEAITKSQNVLIAMLEELLSKKDAEEKKRILADEYGMIMTAELERRIQIMCNWSEAIADRALERGMKRGLERGFEQGIERGIKQGINQGISQGIAKERIAAIGRMLRAGAAREQILAYGYTEDEYAEAEGSVYANS